MKSSTVRAIATIGLVTMLVMAGCGSDDDESSEASGSVELPDEAAAVLDAYNQAVAVDHDGEAMLDVVTEDFTFSSVGNSVLDRDDHAAQVNLYATDFTVEAIGDDVVVGGDDTYIVSQPEDISGGGFFSTGISTFRLVETNDGWLVDAHRFLGDGSAAQ